MPGTEDATESDGKSSFERGKDDVDEVVLDDAEDDNSSAVSEDTIEPECDRANSLSFYVLCTRMERLWLLKRKKRKKKVSEEEKKKYLLPQQMMKKMEPQSVFPLYRLLLPDIDNARNTNMKEKLIAQAYCDAEGFGKKTTNYEMLYGYTDPQKVPHDMAGDLSLVVQHVLSKRIPDRPSKVTVGHINQLLDDLASLRRHQKAHHNHEWRNTSGNTKKKKESLTSLREQWLRKVMSKGLSPLEHKWLVRILLRKMEFGLGWRSLLSYYSPYAMEFWNAHNSLKNLCDKLADPEYHARRKEQEERIRCVEEGTASYWQPQNQPAILGNTISPMLSNRVRFDNCMTMLQENHKKYLEKSSKPPYLALKFPTVSAEIKLDGERMVVHVKDDEVTMHTRNGKWYSQIYSPVLGKPLRQAIANYKVNVILDGEVTSWDNGRQELIPFGSNRTVANYRRLYLQRHGLLDERDKNLHQKSTESSIMRAADEFKFAKPLTSETEDPGKECWLQYLAFDILYVDGPDAKKLFAHCGLDTTKAGSIINLSGLHRKQILHRLLEKQPHQVEICKSVVIRSTGECVPGEKYFSTTNPLMECGYPKTLLDSTQAVIKDGVPDMEQLDRVRRSKSNVEISRQRAQEIEAFYKKVVETDRSEGIVLKDLAAPYILGTASRNRKYWHKFKPDYMKTEGDVVDMDVVILGAYFATGLRHSGQLSHFLCGCVDSEDPSTYMTLCNVNGGSVSYDKLKMIMEVTGFKRATEDEATQLGKWFEEHEHGKSLPNFLSRRSLQRSPDGDFDGWKFTRNKNYPDLWIDPDDSVVLTIYGQELVESEDYSAGISLRFARISKIRHASIDGDEKSASEANTEDELRQIYVENLLRRGEATGELSPFRSTNNQVIRSKECRFITPEAFGRKKKRRKRNVAVSPSKVPKVKSRETNALKGVKFTVLEGNYSFDSNSLEGQESKDQGWLREALRVRSKEDVMAFILRHGGTIMVSAEGNDTFILGGQEQDARVITYMKAIEYAKFQRITKPKTKKEKQLQMMAANIGVLKWHFVFSLVHRWMSKYYDNSKSMNENEDGRSIRETDESMLNPRAHHYLVKNDEKGNALEDIFDINDDAKTTKLDLMRALQECAGSTTKAPVRVPWQVRESYGTQVEDRWVFASQHRIKWNLGAEGSSVDRNKVVIYPDIFRSGFGSNNEDEYVNEVRSGRKSERWQDLLDESCDSILASLPLARAMGALVTPHLHKGVSHILCDMKGGDDYIVYDTNSSVDFCRDIRRYEILLGRIESIGLRGPLNFVSPDWIRSKWTDAM